MKPAEKQFAVFRILTKGERILQKWLFGICFDMSLNSINTQS